MNNPSTGVRAGELDPIFNNGHVSLAHTGTDPLLQALQVTEDGGVLAWSRRAQGAGIDLTKFTRTGEFDPSFNEGSYLHLAFNARADHIHVRAADDFFVVGSRQDTLVVSRFKADGSADTEYGRQGRVEVDVTTLVSQRVSNRVGVARLSPRQDDPTLTPEEWLCGKQPRALPGLTGRTHSFVDGNQVYVVFHAWWGGYEKLLSVVLRLDEQGEVDTTFNGSGYAVVTLPGIEYNFTPHAVWQKTADGSGQVVLLLQEALPVGAPPASARFLVRLTPAGKLDYSFGGDGDDQGLVRVSIQDVESVYDLWTDALHGLKVIGLTAFNNELWAAVKGFTEDGKFDPTFNGGERLLTQVESGRGIWNGGAFYGEGEAARMVFSTSLLRPEYQIAAARLDLLGGLDMSFGSRGITAFKAEGSGFFANTQLLVLADTSIYLGYKGDIYRLLG